MLNHSSFPYFFLEQSFHKMQFSVPFKIDKIKEACTSVNKNCKFDSLHEVPFITLYQIEIYIKDYVIIV